MLQKCSIFRIAGVFFNEPTKDHELSGISRKAGLAHTSAKKHLIELEKNSIIAKIVEQKGKRKFPIYRANADSPEYRKLKFVYNVFQIQDSGLTGFLHDNLMPRSIVLFGSYSRGEDTEDSDVDVFVESEKRELDLSGFEEKLHRKIELHFSRDFKRYSTELKNNIVNGTVLSGYLEAFV